jgi:hypothetical protein
MISDPSGRWLVSSLGWVDHGAIWRFDSESGQVTSIQLSDAAYIRVSAGAGELFTAAHHFNGEQLLITVQSYSDPGRPLSWIEVRDWSPVIAGDVNAWAGLPPAHVAYLNHDATGAAGYFLVRVGGRGASLDRLDWFGDAYDHGYQSVTSAVEMPDGQLLFGVQRSSDLVLCAADTLQVVRTMSLTGHLGNPVPLLRRLASEIWAIDYDTVVRVDYRDWKVTGSTRLETPNGARGFLGGLWMTADERHAVIPRPFDADVIVLDAATMTIIGRHETGGEPLEAACLTDGRIVARDWHTGATLAP